MKLKLLATQCGDRFEFNEMTVCNRAERSVLILLRVSILAIFLGQTSPISDVQSPNLLRRLLKRDGSVPLEHQRASDGRLLSQNYDGFLCKFG